MIQPALPLLAAMLATSPAAAAVAPTPDDLRSLFKALGGRAEPQFKAWADNNGHGTGQDYVRLLAVATPAERTRLHRLAGEAREAFLDWTSALAAYRDAATAATDPGDRASALLGIARIQSVTDPAAADATLASISGEPRAFAAVAHLRGRRALAANDPARAMVLFGEALGHAGRYPGPDTPATIQSLLADLSLAASFTGDDATAAGYAAASGLGAGPGRSYIPIRSPASLCDPAKGPRVDDTAIFDVQVRQGTVSRVAPVWWNRPGAAAAVSALGYLIHDWRWPADPPSVLGRGIRIQVSCTIDGQNDTRGSIIGDITPIVAWFDSKNLPRPPVRAGAPETVHAATVAALLDAESRFDPGSLDLIPYLFAAALNPLTPAEVGRAQIERIIAIVEANGAPRDVVGFLLMALAKDAFEPGDPTDSQAIVASFPARLATWTPAERDSPVGLLMRMVVTKLPTTTAAVAENTLRELAALPPDKLPPDDPLRAQIALRLASILSASGRRAEADRMLVAAGRSPDHCNRADSPIRSIGLAVEPEDFPDMVRRAEIGGFSRIARHVAADGRNDKLRIVYAQPPMLFDKAVAAAFDKARNDLPERGGKPFPCHANIVPVFWQLRNTGPE